MSSIGPPSKRSEFQVESGSSKVQAEALAQRQTDDEAHAAHNTSDASHFESASEVHMSGTLGPEAAPGDVGLEPPSLSTEAHLDHAEGHTPHSQQASATLAHQLHIFHPSAQGMPHMPRGEADDAALLMQSAAWPNAARQKSLQQGQQGFVVPLTLRRPQRTAYTEKPEQETGGHWDVEAIEALIGTLHVGVGGMQTHDDAAMRKERRFRRWLLLLNHRRRVLRKKPLSR